MSSLTSKDIADGWGNRAALEAEAAIQKIDEQLVENDRLLAAGELGYDSWESRQAALRAQFAPQQEIIRYEKARYSELLRERE